MDEFEFVIMNKSTSNIFSMSKPFMELPSLIFKIKIFEVENKPKSLDEIEQIKGIALRDDDQVKLEMRFSYGILHTYGKIGKI